MSQVGALSIAITADGSQATRELGAVDGAVNKSSSNITKSMKSWAKWGAAAAAAAAAAAVALTKMAMTSIDQLAKTSRSMDASIAGLQGLQLAAREAGVSQEEAAASAQMLNQRLGEAARGTGEAAAQLERLGLNAEELQRMDVDQRFAAIAQRTRELGLNSSQTADALRNLGIRNRDMVLLMQQGGEDILSATNRVKDYGLALDEVDAAKVEMANDQLAFARDIMGRGMQEAAIAVAPILTELANKFIDISNEAGGMGNVAVKALDVIVKGVGVVADAFHGWVMIIQGIKTAFHGLHMVTANTFASMLEGLNSTLKFAAEGVNGLIRQMNRIRGVNLEEIVVGESEMAQNLRVAGINAQIEFADAMFGLHEIAARELPSEQFEKFVEQARIKGEEAAQAMLAAQSNATESMEDGSPMFRFSEEENQKFLDSLMKRFATESELYEQQFADELERLTEAREQELLTEEEFLHRREQLADEHADRMADIQEQERKARVGIMKGMMDSLSNLMNTGSRKMFEIGKAAAIASALISGKEAVVSSYAAGAKVGGPKVGALYAATAAASTAAQISQIRSSSFSNGASANTATFSGGVGAVRTTQADGGAPAQRVDINIAGSGSTFTADQVRNLISQINEQVGDGVNVAFSG